MTIPLAVADRTLEAAADGRAPYRQQSAAAAARTAAAAAGLPCAEKVLHARCQSDAGGTWRCQRGFPGETCYNVHSHAGHYSCSPASTLPACDPHGCGTGIPPHSFSQTCRIECRFFAGVCNYAEVTVDCPLKYDANGEPLGNACCTQREADGIRRQACARAEQIIRSNAGCKTNCRVT